MAGEAVDVGAVVMDVEAVAAVTMAVQWRLRRWMQGRSSESVTNPIWI